MEIKERLDKQPEDIWEYWLVTWVYTLSARNEHPLLCYICCVMINQLIHKSALKYVIVICWLKGVGAAHIYVIDLLFGGE